MKHILVGFLIVVSSSLFAQSRVVVTPQNPVDCAKDNVDYVNWISDIKISEDVESVNVSFLTKYGSCKSGVANHESLDSIMVTMLPLGLRLPWQGYGFKINESRKDDKSFEVSIVFNKNKIFKKKNDVSYAMTVRHYALSFNWTLGLAYNPANDTTFVKID